MSPAAQDDLKRQAAAAAAALVEDGMVVGLGSGSTAAFAVAALARRVKAGLRILGIPSSRGTAAQARRLGIALTDFDTHPRIDIALDGADAIATPGLALIKGRGGALVREKIVAASSDRFVVMADASKLVTMLGAGMPVPVEVVPFGWQTTARRLEALGGQPFLRRRADGTPVRSDNGNLTLDCAFGGIAAPADLAARLSALTGVVEHGLFVGLTTAVMMAGPDGVRTLVAASDAPQ